MANIEEELFQDRVLIRKSGCVKTAGRPPRAPPRRPPGAAFACAGCGRPPLPGASPYGPGRLVHAPEGRPCVAAAVLLDRSGPCVP